MITIDIKYKLAGNTDWTVIHLSPEEYFIEDDMPFEVDSVPIYDHEIEYLEEHLSLDELSKVAVTQIVIADDAENTITMTETFWNSQRNRVIERVDTGKDPYSEIILDLRVSDDPVEHEIMRLVRQDGYLIPWYHGFIADNPDGSQSERKVDL